MKATVEQFEVLLPKHEAGLTLTENEHLTVYQTVREYTYGDDEDEWVSPEEKKRAIETNTLWRIQWYPHTPVGHHSLQASSLVALIQAISSKEN